MNTELLTAEVLNEQAYFHYPLETFKNKVSTMIINLVPKVPYYFGYQIEDQFLGTINQFSYDRLFFFTEKHLYEDPPAKGTALQQSNNQDKYYLININCPFENYSSRLYSLFPGQFDASEISSDGQRGRFIRRIEGTALFAQF